MTEAGGEWRRLHPLTPFLRGGRVVAVVLALLTRQVVAELGADRAGLLLLAVIPVAVAYGYLSWRFTRYTITEDALRLETGVLLRRSRRVPLARLQAVDVVRGVVARIFGLAELRLEVVGQGRTEAPFAYLSDDDAQALRAHLLALAAGSVERRADDGTEERAGSRENVLVQVPTPVLVTSVLLDAPAIGGALLIAGAVAAAFVVPLQALPALLVTLLPALAVTGGAAVRRVLADYDFTVAEGADGLRLRHGLLETRAQTIPAGRVQGVRIVEPLLWRHRDWVRVEVDIAGYAGGSHEERSATSTLLPVAPRALAEAVLGRILEGLDPDRLTPSPPPHRARWRAPLLVRFLGAIADERYAATSTGRVRRVLNVVPHAKVQSVRFAQGPWQRRLRLATVHLDIAGQQVRCVAEHRDVDEARQIAAGEAELARQARRASS